MKLLPLILILMFTVSNFSQQPPIEAGVPKALAEWRAGRYSDVRYKLNLTLEKMSPVLKGTIEIRVNVRDTANRSEPPASGGGENAIILDWRKIRGSENLSSVSNVSINGQAVSLAASRPPANAGGSDLHYDEANEHLIFRDGVKAGENVIKLDFTSPILASGSAITRYVDKEDGSEYLYSLFVPSDASTAFPVFDQPDLKAAFDLTIDAPVGWKVVSNSIQNSLVVEGRSGHHLGVFPKGALHWFHTTKPISTYVFAFAAGEFAEYPEVEAAKVWEQLASEGKTKGLGKNEFVIDDEVRARSGTHIFVRKSQAAKFQPHAAEVFRLNREGIRYLEEYFDYKYPFPKYDIVLIPEFPFGGMEHAGATFLRESSIIFPSEPTANDYISRANVIFHEAAHQWFGDTVTMRWFDDLWLKEGFAEFMAYKTLEHAMPQYNAWKAFYERNKPAAYATDSTRGTTPIYQEIPNLSAAKSAYGNIVYRKAPSFLRQAEFYLGPDKFQTAVRAFLKKHEFGSAGWEDLVKEFEAVTFAEKQQSSFYSKLSLKERQEFEEAESDRLKTWANTWVTKRGMPIVRLSPELLNSRYKPDWSINVYHVGITDVAPSEFSQTGTLGEDFNWQQDVQVLKAFANGDRDQVKVNLGLRKFYGRKTEPNPNWDAAGSTQTSTEADEAAKLETRKALFIFPNYQDYGYGIFLLDDKSRDYVLKNIQNEKDDFLRSMMWGTLWDSVREGELDPREYVELAIKNIGVEKDELTIQTILGRVSTAMTYYIQSEDGVGSPTVREGAAGRSKSSGYGGRRADDRIDARGEHTSSAPSLTVGLRTRTADLRSRLEDMLVDRMRAAPTLGQRVTFYRAFLNIASTENARKVLKDMLRNAGGNLSGSEGVPAGRDTPQNAAAQRDTLPTGRVSASVAAIPLKTKDRFDIVTKLAILGDPDASALLAELEKSETSDDAKRYAYAARAAFATKENREKFWNDFVSNKDISESWIEAAMGTFNSPRHSELSLPYLQRALAELPNLKRNRKIFFVNGWLGAFIGGQKSQEALDIVNKFLTDNPGLDRDLRLKVLENVDVVERAVKIRAKFGK